MWAVNFTWKICHEIYFHQTSKLVAFLDTNCHNQTVTAYVTTHPVADHQGLIYSHSSLEHGYGIGLEHFEQQYNRNNKVFCLIQRGRLGDKKSIFHFIEKWDNGMTTNSLLDYRLHFTTFQWRTGVLIYFPSNHCLYFVARQNNFDSQRVGYT